MLLKYALISVICYFIGNFATSLIVGKLAAGIDIRRYGSGNAGATNTFRVLGAKMGLITFLGDAIKGALAVGIGYWIGGQTGMYFAGVSVVAGHNWPALLGFKGGKGVATTIGVMTATCPIYVLLIVPVGILMILWTRYVSLTSVTGMLVMPFALWIGGERLQTILFGGIIAVMSIFAHRSNIRKLLNGTESKLDFKKKGNPDNMIKKED